MYSYQKGVVDQEYHSIKGQALGGVAIGIILFARAGGGLPPGSVENALTFDYPVLFQPIESASVKTVVSPSIDKKVLSQLIEAGLFLEQQGCRAIIGACGYFANYLPDVVQKLHKPCYFSSLMQLPLVLNALRPEQKVGILCADGRVLGSAPVLKNCGLHDRSRLVVAGAEVLPEMKKILADSGSHNPQKLEDELIELGADMLNREPNIGAIVLECTLFPTHAWGIQKALQLPIFDFATLIDWVHSSVVRKQYAGHM